MILKGTKSSFESLALMDDQRRLKDIRWSVHERWLIWSGIESAARIARRKFNPHVETLIVSYTRKESQTSSLKRSRIFLRRTKERFEHCRFDVRCNRISRYSTLHSSRSFLRVYACTRMSLEIEIYWRIQSLRNWPLNSPRWCVNSSIIADESRGIACYCGNLYLDAIGSHRLPTPSIRGD